MQPKSLREWFNVYEKKTQDKVSIPSEKYKLAYLPTRGFMIYKSLINMLFIYQVCGDGKFWLDYAELLCAQMGLSAIGTICTRPLDAYLRTFGGSVLSEQDIDGKKRYLCQDNIGRKVICTHRIMGEKTKIPEYWVTKYLNQKATSSLDDLKIETGVNKKDDLEIKS